MDAYAQLQTIPNWINDSDHLCDSGEARVKFSPVNGQALYKVTQSQDSDVQRMVDGAKQAYAEWSALLPSKRVHYLINMVDIMQGQSNQIAEVIARETGRSLADSLQEVDTAIEQARLCVAEGQKFLEHNTNFSDVEKIMMCVRHAVGVSAMVFASNISFRQIIQDVFIALTCGNTVIIKPSQDLPMLAWYLAQISHEANLPTGVLNILQGSGSVAGEHLVAHSDVALIHFRGTKHTGRRIGAIGGERMAKVSVGLSSQHSLIVLDDADINESVAWTIASAFSPYGLNSNTPSRVIVHASIYGKFKELLQQEIKSIKIGSYNGCQLGPVMNQEQLTSILYSIKQAVLRGDYLLHGGQRLTDGQLKDGYYIAPTILERYSEIDEISQAEITGPITCLQVVEDADEALRICNQGQYDAQVTIHTRDVNGAMLLSRQLDAESVNINESFQEYSSASSIAETLDKFSRKMHIQIKVDCQRTG